MGKKRRKKGVLFDKHQVGLDNLVERYLKKPYIRSYEQNVEYPNSGRVLGEVDFSYQNFYDVKVNVEYKSNHSQHLYKKAVSQILRWIDYNKIKSNQTLYGIYYSPQTGPIRIAKYKNGELIRK